MPELLYRARQYDPSLRPGQTGLYVLRIEAEYLAQGPPQVWQVTWDGTWTHDPRAMEKAVRITEIDPKEFESMIEQLLQGYPVGAAMDYFGARYAALSTELTAAFDAFREPDDFELAELWTANHDARGYVIVGDPAVRLRVAATAAQATARKDLERGA